MLQEKPLVEDAAPDGPLYGYATGSRLVIHKMALTNFKSYAGSQTIGPFHKSFTAVVGPNGSGKSNVIDALLFVFGYRASRMRQPKVADLIHHSELHPNLEFCSVDIHFYEMDIKATFSSFNRSNQETTGVAVPGSELIISRKAQKSGKSDYFINGALHSFADVTSLLMEKGVDLDHNRFLILQGEVESIALMKPKGTNDLEEGLLEYLEDIIGTAKYKPLLSSAFSSLEALSQDANGKISLLRLAERELTSVRETKNEVEKYLYQENDLTLKKSLYFSALKYQSSLDEEKSGSDLIKIEEEVKRHEELATKHDKASSSLETDFAISQEKVRLLQQQLEVSRQELGELEKKDIQLTENRKYLKGKLNKLAKSALSDRSALIEKKQRLDCVQVELDSKSSDLLNLESQMKTAESSLEKSKSNLQGKRKGDDTKICTLQHQLVPLTDNLTEIEGKIDIAESQLKLLKEADGTVGDRESCANEISTLENSIQSKNAERQTVSGHIEAKNAELEATKMAHESLLAQEQKLDAVLKNLFSNSADLKADILASTTNNSKVLESLFSEMKCDSTIPSDGIIYGKLCELGTIATEYDKALRAATNALDNIVVNTAKMGQWAIEVLKRKNLGRCTFIILEKLAAPSPSTVQIDKSVHRIYDLIEVTDNALKPAFWYALRDTLVTTTLAEANKVAFGRNGSRQRVVTQDGLLIEKSGAMTGGGASAESSNVTKGSTLKAKATSSAAVSQLRKDLDKVEKDIKSMTTHLESTKRQITDCTLRETELEQELESWKLKSLKCDREIGFMEDKRKALQEQLRTLSTTSKDITTKSKQISSCEKDLRVLFAEKIALAEKVASLRSKIEKEEEVFLTAGGVQYRVQLSQVSNLKEQLHTVKERICKLKQEKILLDKSVERLEASTSDDNNNEKKWQAEMEGYQRESEELMRKGLILKKEMEPKEDLLNEQKEILEKIKSEINNVKKILKEISSRLDECKGEKRASRDLIEKSRKAMKHWQSEWDKLKLHHLSSSSIGDTSNAMDVDEEKAVLPIAVPSESDIVEVIRKLDKLGKDIQLEQDKLEERRPNLAVLDEYKKVMRDYNTLASETNMLVNKRDEMKVNYEQLKKERLDMFMKGFHIISMKLKEMYQMITLGGNAELELVDSLDPFSEGVLFSVMPPKKTWKTISNLSGGEKTLSSLALVFALHHYRPTPFYVMDEIDAALDFRNVSIVANYIKERTACAAQFIVISLRNNMFERADELVGIYKTKQCTKSVAFCPGKIQTEMLNQNEQLSKPNRCSFIPAS